MFVLLKYCTNVIGDFFVGWAGLFNLFASFKAIGEPAPTGYLE
jgi:hypothetical protein